jgi:hypothetical protein
MSLSRAATVASDARSNGDRCLKPITNGHRFSRGQAVVANVRRQSRARAARATIGVQQQIAAGELEDLEDGMSDRIGALVREW